MGARKLEDLFNELPKFKEDELAQVFSLVEKIKEERKNEVNATKHLSLDDKIALMHNTFKNYKGSSEAFISNKAIEKLLDK